MRAAQFIVAAAATLAACTVGPDFTPPKPPAIANWRDRSVHEVAARSMVTQQTNPDPRWWDGFQDAVMTGVINQAIAGNLDLQQAILRVVEARQGELLAACSEHQAALCRRAASALKEHYQRIIDSGASAAQPSSPAAHNDVELAASFAAELRLTGLQAARKELHEAESSAEIDEQTAKSISAEFDLTELSLRSGL